MMGYFTNNLVCCTKDQLLKLIKEKKNPKYCLLFSGGRGSSKGPFLLFFDKGKYRYVEGNDDGECNPV